MLGNTAREASGVLEVTGRPSGAVYLDGGRIAFARASWVPGLAARLRAVTPALAILAETAQGGGAFGADDADDAAVAGLAVQRGYVTPIALRELIRSIVVDAFLVLALPLAADSPVAGIRFISTRTYWTEIFPRFSIGQVREEAFRVAERLAEHGLTPTTAVALCDLRAPAAVLTREQWAVACRIGSHASALDLAARRGAALAETLDCLGTLTRAGLCTPLRARACAEVAHEPPSPSRVRSADPWSPPPPHSSAEHLPARHPAEELMARHFGHGQPPSVDLLRQVLAGLKKLS